MDIRAIHAVALVIAMLPGGGVAYARRDTQVLKVDGWSLSLRWTQNSAR